LGRRDYFLVACAVYHAARVLRASTRDVIVEFRGWRRDPETFWWGAAWIAAALILAISAVIRIGT